MKRYAVLLMCLGLFGLPVWAQSSRSTRPRVVANPAPTVENQTTNGQPPTLKGATRNLPASPAPTPVTGEIVEEDDDVIKVETNLVTFPVSVLDRDGTIYHRFEKRRFPDFRERQTAAD